MEKNRSIDSYFITDQILNNRILVRSSVDVVRMISFQGWPIQGYHEYSETTPSGNFLGMLELLSSSNKKIRGAMDASPKNAFYTSLKFPKEILQVFARQVRNVIQNEIGDAKFCVIFDGAIDESRKDYISVVLRFVDGDGLIRERFIGVIPILDYAPSALKTAVYSLLSHHNLDVQNIRGQSYNAGNNLWECFQELQPLISSDFPCAYFFHCSTHCLQMALIQAASKVAMPVCGLFIFLPKVVDMVRVFCKHNEELKPAYASKFECMISVEDEEIPGRSSHLKSVFCLLEMYDETCTLLEEMIEEKTTLFDFGDLYFTFNQLSTFDFVFALHLMKEIMGVTHLLCQVLESQSLNIPNMMGLVASTKFILQKLRQEKGDSMLASVSLFCEKWDLTVPDFGAQYVARRSLRRSKQEDFTVDDYYRVNVFNAAIDSQLEELDRRFSQNAMDLLRLTLALSPQVAFEKLITYDVCQLVEKLYPQDFTNVERIKLRVEVKDYELNVVSHEDYKKLSTISELCQWLVKTKLSAVYKLIYRVIVLVLTLPFFTAATERSISAINTIKTRFREEMDDFLVSESLLIFIEREIAETFSTKTIMEALREEKEHLVPF